MGLYQRIKGYFCKQKTRNMDNIIEGYEFPDTTKDFFEGMRSIGDITGERYFNDFKNFPTDPRERIWRAWNNAGSNLHNAMDSFAKQNGLPRPHSFDNNIQY